MFGQNKFWGKMNCWSKKILGMKNSRSKQILGAKHLVQKVLGSKKLWSKFWVVVIIIAFVIVKNRAKMKIPRVM